MEQLVSQLKKEFYSKLRAFTQGQSTLNHLTEEELAELESAWIDLALWKKAQTL
ncbi:hypothetical protein [Vibrio maerlii]|uniref:hypothetical protein n=1 Tax=Vibrio maerlii TaxID=2231648 RepID=UPI0013E05D37|nr:hypothetical protein [Vibrio maerlii]